PTPTQTADSAHPPTHHRTPAHGQQRPQLVGARSMTVLASATSAEEIRLHRANGVRTVEMNAAALFALGAVSSLPVASALVVDGVANDPVTEWTVDLHSAGQSLQSLLASTVESLAYA